jgi:hypothetical protein
LPHDRQVYDQIDLVAAYSLPRITGEYLKDTSQLGGRMRRICQMFVQVGHVVAGVNGVTQVVNEIQVE